ncbi:noroxomaritidine synthase 2-like [Panicum virgatum]|uniref:noroxomaritidine synthase 2-like n=1 Tax=Panicum virgatum TaxID=38727 RepID=UPI0019D57B19|nr:noroxomaritidine synthase 2-like [Panicum virgatum]
MDPLFLFIAEAFLILCLLISYYNHLQSRKTSPSEPTEWPIVGHLLSLAANIHNFHDWATGVLAGSGYNFEARLGLTGLRFFLTCDPSNVRHVFTANFANYPKGDKFTVIFDVLGGGIFNSDGESWRRQRVKTQTLLADPRFRAFTARCCRDKVARSLLPFLAHAADTGRPCDLSDVVLRLSFDMTCTLVFGVDPGCLATGLPVVPFMRATDDALETLFLRYITPMALWKLMRRLNVGPERKMAAARRAIDSFVAETVARRRADKAKDEGAAATDGDDDDSAAADLLSSFLSDEESSSTSDEFIRDTMVNFLVAGRDGIAVTLSWFFYLVSANPRVEQKLLGELSLVVAARNNNGGAAAGGSAADTTTSGSGAVTFDASETHSMAYLHAALCESLRLYPPIPFEHKTAAAADVLPSGKELEAGDQVLFFTYSMGRMEGVWGKDCAEFRPERWLTAEGRLRHEPPYRFFSFNAGPRTCLGKQMVFVQMKTVAAAVLWNFAVDVVTGHAVEPKLSIVLHMKNGLAVRVRRRDDVMGHGRS